MRAVVFYELGDVTMDRVWEAYPRHKKQVDEYFAKGKIMAIGTFKNPQEGSMGIFTDKESAEEFVKTDPFVVEKMVGKVTIREWNVTLEQKT
ncbi:MAG TPA: hypothetical protein VLX68_12310 [Chitinivibrionales bacterium]|nr:hypothetical protein [Chitinivibrionales bacterium]